MTANPLDLIEARAQAASDGPWEVTAFDSGHSRFEMSVSICTADVGDSICDMDGLSRSLNEKWATNDGFTDAEFIAHAREDVPKLVAALRAVEAVLANWEADGEVDIAISKTIPNSNTGTQLLINGSDKIENARIIRQVIREALNG